MRIRSRQRQKETDKEEIKKSLEHFSCDSNIFSTKLAKSHVCYFIPESLLPVRSVFFHHVSLTAAPRRVEVNLDLSLRETQSSGHNTQHSVINNR